MIALAITVIILAAGFTAFRVLMRHQPRPAGQHAAPRTMIVDVTAGNTGPAGYGGEDTDTWLTRPAATGAYDQLAPAVLDAAADTMPPWQSADTQPAIAAVTAAPVPEPEPELAELPPFARQGVWEPRRMPPRPGPVGRHRAPGRDPGRQIADWAAREHEHAGKGRFPDPVQWLADLETTTPAGPQPTAEFTLPAWDTDAAGLPPITADVAAGAGSLPPVAFIALGGQSVTEFVNDLFTRAEEAAGA